MELITRGGDFTSAALGDTRSRDAIDRVDGVRASGPAGRPDPGEAILPLGSTASDEFASRLAAWLADIAMDDQGAV